MSTSTEKVVDTELLKEAELAVRKFGFEAVQTSILETDPNCLKVLALTKLDKKVDLFLKCIGECSSDSQLKSKTDRQRWLTEQLSLNGFKLIPQFYKTIDESSLLIQNEKYWTCQSFVKFETAYEWLDFDCSSQHCFQSGQALAELHSAGAKLLRRKSDLTGFKNSIQILNDFVPDFQNTIARMQEAGKANSPEWERLKKLDFGKVLKNASLLVQDILQIEKSSKQTINHGDFHPGNVLFSANGVQAVVDWDYSCIGGGIFDLCYALFMFCLQGLQDGDAELFSARNTESFLNGYNPGSMTVKNMQTLTLFTEFTHLLMLSWACSELLNPKSRYTKKPGWAKLLGALAAVI